MFADAVARGKLEERVQQLEQEMRYLLDLVETNLHVDDDLHVKYAKRLILQFESEPPLRSSELVRCPVCDVQFKAKSRGALVIVGAGDWKGVDVIRCPKCLRRERTPNAADQPRLADRDNPMKP